MKKLNIPAFRSEAAEARWWYEHFAQAGKAGTLKKLTREESLKRMSKSRVISIRLPEGDLARLRRLAAWTVRRLVRGLAARAGRLVMMQRKAEDSLR
jgi:hypothetical protein